MKSKLWKSRESRFQLRAKHQKRKSNAMSDAILTKSVRSRWSSELTFNSAPAVLVQFASLLGRRHVVRRGRGRRVLLIRGIQELVEAAGGLTVVAVVVVVVVSLDGVDVSIVDGRGVDRPLRHVIQAKRENSDEARTRGVIAIGAASRLTCRRRKEYTVPRCGTRRSLTIN